MSIVKLTPDHFEQFTLVTHPKRTYTSSSMGVTGSAYVYSRRSDSEKETAPLSAFIDSVHSDVNVNSLLRSIQKSGSSDISLGMSAYMSLVHSQSSSARLNKEVTIQRLTPDSVFSSNTTKKSNIKNILMPYYRPFSPSSHFSYTNYHSLNFFTASDVPSKSVLVYPNLSSSRDDGQYNLTGGFSFDFHINPRYTTDEPHGEFRAGCILHLSSSYGLFLVTGSSKDINGYPDGFRVMLMLSHSAGKDPASVNMSTANNARTYPENLVFLSSDNSLRLGNWHHVVVRWGTSTRGLGSGSFEIDQRTSGTFVIPSASIAPTGLSYTPDVLLVGNAWATGSTGDSRPGLLLNSLAAARDGLVTVNADTSEPTDSSLTYPLNAEIHGLKIFDHWRDDDQIYSSSLRGMGADDFAGMRFYLPPFFTKESPRQKLQSGQGGILQTPFFSVDGMTEDPINVPMSFGVGGHYLNIENFTRDFVTANYPRLYCLTASSITTTTEVKTCNEFLYTTGSVRKRNLSVLPCDDGTFSPNFFLLRSSSIDLTPNSGSSHDRYINSLGNLDFSLIRLDNLVSTGSIQKSVPFDSGSLSAIMGPTPTDMGISPGSVYSIYQRTRDPSSNEVVIFDISNLYYGKRILPKSLTITDDNITGSSGKIGMILKDDGFGNLYRADAKTKHATWASVGNVFYSEGIVIVKSPNIPMFGQNGFKIEFSGEQSVHTMKISATAPAGMINSSSNPSFRHLSASNSSNDADNTGFVYITGLNFHDDNLNVIMRTNLAQPVTKRNGDKILVRTKMDW